MTDPPTFLLARLAEDEENARRAVIPAHDAPGAYHPHPELAAWRYEADEADGEVVYDYDDPHEYPERYYVTLDAEGLSPSVDERVGPHIARHDPARVLRQVAAMRRVVEEHCEVWHTHWADVRETACSACVRDPLASGDTWPCPTIRALAAIWADHPDYREEWAL